TGKNRNATTFPGGNPPPPDPELLDCFDSIYAHTLWYTVEFPADTIVVVDTTGSDFDTVLAVYEETGPGFGGLTFLDCNDDNILLESQVTFLAEAGKKYQIQVGGFAGDNGHLSISFSEGAPASAAPAGPVEHEKEEVDGRTPGPGEGSSRCGPARPPAHASARPSPGGSRPVREQHALELGRGRRW
ncbi:MAG: hypothetical protein DMD83_26935, partial [Candidatus Rokuibacteriota bacterium]